MEKNIEEILKNVIKYCENQQIYDKLSSYGNFYYKIKRLLKENEENKLNDNIISSINSKPIYKTVFGDILQNT